MPTVTIPRDITGQELTEALTQRLGTNYRVQAATRVNWGLGEAEGADADNIVVSSGSGRFIRTQVSIERDGSGHSVVHIEPPGPVQLRLINTLGISKKVRQALLDWTQGT